MSEQDHRRYVHVNLPHVRSLFECLGDEGRALALRCGERADSPFR